MLSRGAYVRPVTHMAVFFAFLAKWNGSCHRCRKRAFLSLVRGGPSSIGVRLSEGSAEAQSGRMPRQMVVELGRDY